MGPAQLHLAESSVMGSAQRDGCLAQQIKQDPLDSGWLGYSALTRGTRARVPVAECPCVAQWTSLGWLQTRWTQARTLVGPAQLHLADSIVMGSAQRDGCLAQKIKQDPL